MALSTYAELKTAVASWLSRTDLTAAIPDFIRLAEARMSRELRVQQMIETQTGTLAADSMAVPAGFLEVASFVFLSSPRTPAEYRAPEVFFQLDVFSTTGKPRYATVLDDLIYVGPVPSATGESYELRYYKEITALSDSATSNWLLAKAPDAYLFAALVEAEPFLMNDERMAFWKARADLAVGQLNGNDRRLKAKGMGQRARSA